MRVRKEALAFLFAGCLFLLIPLQRVTGSRAQALNQQFQTAVSNYQSRHYSQARRIVAGLLRQDPENFELNELMGLVCQAQGKSADAEAYLSKAVELRPASAEARMHWASNLIALHQYAGAGKEFRAAVGLDPSNYDTNHNLGEFYIATGKLSAAIPYLRKAQQVAPSSVANGHDLVLAEIRTGQLEAAKAQLNRLLALRASPDLVSLLASVDERTGQYVEAAKEYQLAARMNPTEENIFAWGSEMLLHHALGPAGQIFEQGARLYPRSRRLQIGLGIALYSRAHYREAADAFSRAVKLEPADPRPYQMLSMVYDISPAEAPDVTEKLARIAEVEPQNPDALYYYGLCLWKSSRAEHSRRDLQKIEELFKSAATLDPAFADAHLQLGIVYWQQNRIREAIDQYRQALRSQPGLAEAHYRLAAALVRIGDRAEARREYAIYSRLHAVGLKEKEKKRSAILQFETILASPAKGPE